MPETGAEEYYTFCARRSLMSRGGATPGLRGKERSGAHRCGMSPQRECRSTLTVAEPLPVEGASPERSGSAHTMRVTPGDDGPHQRVNGSQTSCLDNHRPLASGQCPSRQSATDGTSEPLPGRSVLLPQRADENPMGVTVLGASQGTMPTPSAANVTPGHNTPLPSKSRSGYRLAIVEVGLRYADDSGRSRINAVAHPVDEGCHATVEGTGSPHARQVWVGSVPGLRSGVLDTNRSRTVRPQNRPPEQSQNRRLRFRTDPIAVTPVAA